MLGSWLILRWALKQMDPNRNAKALAKLRKKELARRLGRPINLDGQYEDVRVPLHGRCPATLLLRCRRLGGHACARAVSVPCGRLPPAPAPSVQPRNRRWLPQPSPSPPQ